MSEPNACFYQTLGVARDASLAQIRKAYLSLARQLHPDKCGHAHAHIALAAAGEAWAVLRDARLRRVYDEEGREGLDMLSDEDEGSSIASFSRAGHGFPHSSGDVVELDAITTYSQDSPVAGEQTMDGGPACEGGDSRSEREAYEEPRKKEQGREAMESTKVPSPRVTRELEEGMCETQRAKLAALQDELTEERERWRREVGRDEEAVSCLHRARRETKEEQEALRRELSLATGQATDEARVAWREVAKSQQNVELEKALSRIREEERERLEEALASSKAVWELEEKKRLEAAIERARERWASMARGEWASAEASRRATLRAALLDSAAEERVAAVQREQKAMRAAHEIEMREVEAAVAVKFQKQEEEHASRLQHAEELASSRLKKSLAAERTKMINEWTSRVSRAEEKAGERAQVTCETRGRIELELLRSELRREADERVSMKEASAAEKSRRVEAEASQKLRDGLRENSIAASRAVKQQAAQLAVMQVGGIPRSVVEAAALPLVQRQVEGLREQMVSQMRAEVERETAGLREELHAARGEQAVAEQARREAEAEVGRLEGAMRDVEQEAMRAASSRSRLAELEDILALARPLLEQVSSMIE